MVTPPNKRVLSQILVSEQWLLVHVVIAKVPRAILRLKKLEWMGGVVRA
jgi:hypothetical protein